MRYPALALPEGPDDQLVLPADHKDFFLGAIANRTIDILAIGYSGLDQEVLKLVRQVEPRVRRMTIVNTERDTARRVGERLRDTSLIPEWPPVLFNGDFAKWTTSGGLNRLVEEYDGPYDVA